MPEPTIITRLSRPSRQGFCAVYAGRDKVASVDLDTIRRHGLERGTPWTDTLAARVLAESAAARARVDALRTVARRIVTRKQLIDALCRKKHARPVATAVADELVGRGLINDAAAAESIARTTLARKPAGRRLIEAKLASKGVSRPEAARAATIALRGRDPFEDAMSLARKKAARFKPAMEPMVKRRRLFGLLARRGFDGDVCARVVERVIKGSD